MVSEVKSDLVPTCAQEGGVVVQTGEMLWLVRRAGEARFQATQLVQRHGLSQPKWQEKPEGTCMSCTYTRRWQWGRGEVGAWYTVVAYR